MTDWRSLRHFLWLALLVALSGTFAGCLGCQQAPEPTADALRMAFAEQSARVLDGDVAFVATDDGFAVTAPERALRAALLKAGADAVHFEVEGLAIDVVEDGSLEAGEIAGSAVESMARQPEATNDIRGAMILTAALVEGAALFAIVVAFLLQTKVLAS